MVKYIQTNKISRGISILGGMGCVSLTHIRSGNIEYGYTSEKVGMIWDIKAGSETRKWSSDETSGGSVHGDDAEFQFEPVSFGRKESKVYEMYTQFGAIPDKLLTLLTAYALGTCKSRDRTEKQLELKAMIGDALQKLLYLLFVASFKPEFSDEIMKRLEKIADQHEQYGMLLFMVKIVGLLPKAEYVVSHRNESKLGFAVRFNNMLINSSGTEILVNAGTIEKNFSELEKLLGEIGDLLLFLGMYSQKPTFPVCHDGLSGTAHDLPAFKLIKSKEGAGEPERSGEVYTKENIDVDYTYDEIRTDMLSYFVFNHKVVIGSKTEYREFIAFMSSVNPYGGVLEYDLVEPFVFKGAGERFKAREKTIVDHEKGKPFSGNPADPNKPAEEPFKPPRRPIKPAETPEELREKIAQREADGLPVKHERARLAVLEATKSDETSEDE